MIKQMYGWKVLVKNYRNSISTSKKCTLTYPVNKIVKPLMPFSYLFFFKNKQDAENFVKFHGCEKVFIIVPCIAYNCKKIKFVAFLSSIEEFWKVKHSKKRLNPYCIENSPKGSWIAKSIKCLN